jgi:heavy metal translocating P-type ATPase
LGVENAGNVSWIIVAACGAALSVYSVVQSILRGRLGVDIIALLALVGAVAVGEYLAGAVISLMLASGRALEDWADGRARRELRALMERAPKLAHRYFDGGLVTIELERIVPGDLLMVASGELVPVDGTLVSLGAVLDESALTGEPLSVNRTRGESIRSGVVNAGAPLDLRATVSAADSTYAGIIRLVSQAGASEAPSVRLADRYALGFLTVTLITAGIAWFVAGPIRAVAVLVVATPCPLILAAPVAFVAGLSRAARRGIVVKGGAVIERLGICTTLLLDKTGTLTQGHPTLEAIVSAGPMLANEVLALAASLDQVSPHVVANAVVKTAIERGCNLELPTEVVESAGRGIRGIVSGHKVAVGGADWCEVVGTPAWAKSARRKAHLDGALSVFVAVDNVPVGVLIFSDALRPDAARTIRKLRAIGIKRVVLITGDRHEVAETVGAVVGVDDVMAECSPQEKLEIVRLENLDAPTIMVGDGINDAPALALANVGVAMGVRGATAASEAADVVLAVDRIDRLSEAIALSQRTRRIAIESMVAGMAMSLVAMAAAVVGLLPAVWGAMLQEVIDVAVILNALRALHGGRNETGLGPEGSALTKRFHDEHLAIRDDIDRIREVADALGTLEPGEAMERLRYVHRILIEEVQPHEEAEELQLYPVLGQFFGGRDPMGTMSRAHVEIAHQIRRLGKLIDDVGSDGIDLVDLTEFRGVLYGLNAILRLHTAQEDENYLSLNDEVTSP